MPIINVDSETADLLEVASYMLEQALEARKKRADPDQIISDSLALQAMKMKGVRLALAMQEPPTFDELTADQIDMVTALAIDISSHPKLAVKKSSYRRLQAFMQAGRPPKP